MSGIQIRIKAGATFEESSVTATGQLVNIIADSERASFGIGSDADLKRAVGNYFGKEPYKAILHSSTFADDLYKTYGWEEVQRVLQPKKAEILDVTTKPTIVNTQTLTNESNQTATFSTKISEQVSNSVSNEWSNSSTVSVGQKISYGISFNGINVGGETTFGFEQNWGESKTVSQQRTLGTETGVTVDLKPGESAIAELRASSGKMRVRITYEAHLTGGTAFDYKEKYKGHWYWWMPIEVVLGGSKKVQIIEDVEVGFYSNATATVKNRATMEPMMFHMADHAHEPPSEK